MLTQAKADGMNREVTAFLDRQFPNAPGYKASLLSLWQTYLALGLPNAHFVKEFTSGKRECVFQRAWEMMLARHLDAQLMLSCLSMSSTIILPASASRNAF
jgi:hypothetical protein